MMLSCDCDDWKEGAKQIIGAQQLADNHGYKYSGKTFIYCPWCSSKLKKNLIPDTIVHGNQ